MIAAAIVNRPKLLLLDEPTTALDVTIQAQILEMLKKLNRESGVSMLFISHNLKVLTAQHAAFPIPGGNILKGEYQFVRHGRSSFRFRVGMASMSFWV